MSTRKWTYGRISDFTICHGDIEVYTDENTLSIEIKVCDG
jgi:hypothetical protein